MAVVMGDVGRPSPLHGAAGGGGLAPVRRGRSNHAAAQSRLAAHGARRCEQQAGCVGAPGRAPAENVRRSRLEKGPHCPAGVLGQAREECARITQDRKMQREGLGTCKGSELYFETNKQLSRKVFNGFRPWPGPACRSRRRRRGRGVSDGGQPPVGGRFCQQNVPVLA